MTFTWLELVATSVTRSGLGFNSASMWRVSLLNHLRVSISFAGADETEPPICRIMSGTIWRFEPLPSVHGSAWIRVRDAASFAAHQRMAWRGAPGAPLLPGLAGVPFSLRMQASTPSMMARDAFARRTSTLPHGNRRLMRRACR